MAIAIIPKELQYCVKDLFNPIKTIEFHKLFESDYAPLGYAETMNQLDMWHEVGIWSNAPQLIQTQDMSTTDYIDIVKNSMSNPEMVHFIAQSIHTVTKIPEETVTEWLHNGPTPQFCETMQNLRKFAEEL